MSGKVTGWLLRHPDGPDELAYRMVLVAMADLADNDAGNIRGASRYVAELARVSRRYARDLIGRAVEEEWLEVTRPGDRRRPTVYRFRLDSAAPIASAEDDGAPITRPVVMGATGTPITLPAEKVMGGASAHTWAARERPQRAARERPNTVLRSNGFSADPAPDPKGVRSGATDGPPAAAAGGSSGPGYFSPGSGWIPDWSAEADEDDDPDAGPPPEVIAARTEIEKWRRAERDRRRSTEEPT